MTNSNHIAALIVAGGYATRFGKLGKLLPKTLFQVGDSTILHRLIEQCQSAGVDEILISVSRRFEKIISATVDPSLYSVPINYIVEESPLGTASALASFAPILDNKACLLVLGDEYYAQNKSFCQLATQLRVAEPQSMILGVIHQSTFKEMACNIVLGDDGRVQKIIDKPQPTQIIGTVRWGCLVGFGPETLGVLSKIHQEHTLPSSHIGDALDYVRVSGATVNTIDIEGFELNINEPNDILLANAVIAADSSQNQELVENLHQLISVLRR